MSGVNDGGPAFPSEQHETQDGAWNQTYEPGMSLRDWFAGQVAAGMGDLPYERFDDTVQRRDVLYREHAKRIYRFADAMLEARKVQS